MMLVKDGLFSYVLLQAVQAVVVRQTMLQTDGRHLTTIKRHAHMQPDKDMHLAAT